MSGLEEVYAPLLNLQATVAGQPHGRGLKASIQGFPRCSLLQTFVGDRSQNRGRPRRIVVAQYCSCHCTATATAVTATTTYYHYHYDDY